MTSADLSLLEPWEPLSPDQAKEFSGELNRELTVQHPLYGVSMTPVARSKAADDVLFSMKNEQVAMVHLTWSGQPETPPFPHHKLYPTLDAWTKQLMVPEHAEYSGLRSPPTR